MSWPTSEQFDTAAEQGAQYAMDERRNGATKAQESPLSGEWADGPTPLTVAINVGYSPASLDEQEDIAELADAWERGYFDAWTHSIGAD